MSKAFNREDADASFDAPARPTRPSERRLTAYGARLARDRIAELATSGGPSERFRDLLDKASVVEPAGADHVALGARVHVRTRGGAERAYVIATLDEIGLVPAAISAASPMAQALLGARVGETVEVELPHGSEELTVLSIDWPV